MEKCLICGGTIPQGSNNCPGCGVVVSTGTSAAATVTSTRPSLDEAATGRPSQDEIQAGFQQASSFQRQDTGFQRQDTGFQQQTLTHSHIDTHLVKSILTTLFCCLPLGITSIVFASQVNSKELHGDIAGAQEASRKADAFANWGIGIGVITTALNILLQIAAAGLSGY